MFDSKQFLIHMKHKLLTFLVLWCLSIGFTHAQNRTVRGVVTSAQTGEGLSAATVRISGTSRSVQTADDGSYSINVDSEKSLVFSVLGFEEKTLEITPSGILNVALSPSEEALEEVIVVAYGTANKATHVGSSAQISNKDFENRPITNVTSALVGSAPGVQGNLAGGAPGSGASIRVRGFGSISASNSPLYVVDGVPYDGGTANINPDDVESISILKDASTTSLYGSRAANGVVMITTKKGKQGQSNFTVNASAGAISRGLPEYDRINAHQYYPMMWEAYRNSLAYGSSAIPLDIANSIAAGQTPSYNGNSYDGIFSLLGYNPFNVANDQIVGADGTLNPNAQLLYPDDLDWQNAMQRGGKSRQAYNLTYDGGAGKTNYFASLGYTDDRGYLLKSDMKRINGRVNVNTQPTSWMKTGLNLSGNYNISNYDNAAGGGSSAINPFNATRYMGPIYPVYAHDPSTGAYLLDENGNKQYDFGDQRPYWGGRNVIWENELDSQREVRSALGGRTFLEVQILPQLKATTNIGFDVQDTHQRLYDNPIIGDGAPAGRAYHYLRRTTSYTWNQLLEYNQSFGRHNVNVLMGHENYAYKYNYLMGSRSEMIVDGITELPNFATVLGTSSYEDNTTIESYFSRASYDFDKKYIINASLRRDGNSKFHPDFRWDNFWSVGAAYNIEREDFFKASWVDLLKVRSSYGVVGNDGGLGLYPYQALYTLGRNNADKPGFTQASLPNDSLTWETGKNFDVGVDFAFLNNRISGAVEYFDRVTDGLIFAVPVPLMNGGVVNSSPYYHTIDMNIGSLYNRGFEVTLTGDVVRKDDFSYSTTINATTFRNKITKMPPSQSMIQSGTKGYSVGHSIYDFYLREYYGVDPENGDALYKTDQETSNTRIIGADTVTNVLGEANYRYTGHSSIPDVYGSMSHNLRYKNFSLSVMFTYQFGGKIYDSAYAGLMSSGSYGQAMHVDMLSDRWQNPGDVTDVPRLDASNTANLSGQSSRFLTDASYFNLNNVTFGYNVPKKWLSAASIREVYLYASGENLGLLSARKGMNVLGSFNGTVDNVYNFNRLISFGARIKF